MKKLVVCDIDNTLVVKHEPLSDYGKRMIKALKDNGFLFGLASGRSVGQLKELEKEWGIHSELIIGINGCEIYDGIDNQFTKLYTMDPEWVKESIDIMAEFDTIPCGAYGDTWVSLNKGNAADSAKYLKNDDMFLFIDKVEDFLKYDMSKMCYRVSEKDMPRVEAKVNKIKDKGYKPLKTETTMMEFCNKNASKGNALIAFCKKHDIDLKDVWAFGDMDNDLDMIEASGNGVCMLNGTENVKKHSKYITEKTIKEDGWAYFVEHHLL